MRRSCQTDVSTWCRRQSLSQYWNCCDGGTQRPILLAADEGDISTLCLLVCSVQLRRIRRSLDTESAKTSLVHAFVTSPVDCCNTMLAWSPTSTTDRLQRVLNVAARVGIVVLGRSTVAWRSYVTLSCTGWTFPNVSTMSLEWPFTGVSKAWCPSTWWTAAHILQMSPAVSAFALSAATSSSSHDIVTAFRSSGIFCVGPMTWNCDPTEDAIFFEY